MATRRSKGAACLLAAVFLSAAMALPAGAAADGFLFYGKGDTPADYAPNMAVWNGVKGAFSAKVANGVRLGTAKAAGAYFAFPTYLVAEKSDFSGMKMIEISLKNEKSYSVDIGVVISDNEPYTMTGHEHFSLKTNVKACIRTADGKLLGRTTYGESINIPGSFDGKVYVPLRKEDWAPLSWATVDGELNLKKITNVSYTLNSADASVIIGDVRVIAEDLLPQAAFTPFPTTTTSTTVPGGRTASPTAAGTGQGGATQAGDPPAPTQAGATGNTAAPGSEAAAAGPAPTNAAGDPLPTNAAGEPVPAPDGGSWLPYVIGGGAALLVIAAAVAGLLLYWKRKATPPEPPPT